MQSGATVRANYLWTALRRARGKSAGQFVRWTLLNVWPLSFLTRSYYRLRWAPPIRQRLNRKAICALRENPPSLDAEQSRCVRELSSDGICATTLASLTGDADLFARVRGESERLLASPENTRQIANRRADRTPKWYVIRGLGYGFGATLPAAVAEVCLHPRILAVASTYLGACCRLCYANVWYNIPTAPDEPSIDSELWHRDHEDRNIVKVYVYLEDVDEQMGPLSYLRGTQPGGAYGDVYPVTSPAGSYPRAERLNERVPATTAISCPGSAGTVILCDTAGFHRGGRSTTRPRILLTATYVSDSGIDRRRYELEPSAASNPLDLAARFALWQA